MNIFIYTLSGLEYCNIKIDNSLNISKILDIIISNLERPYITFSILSKKNKLLHNFLKDKDTIELENYIYNSFTTNHILYIIIEEYYDNENRSLVEYKNYLNNLSYIECKMIAQRADFSIRDKYLIINILDKYGELLSLLNNKFKEDKK